jgi:DNA-binding NarL/FixJ family response regulator
MSKVRLVIVDDHEIVRLGLSRALRDNPDFEIVGEAANGSDSVALVQLLKPDVVLMDLRMPFMSGLDATRLIKEKTKGVRVLMLTSIDEPLDVQACLAAGADGYCVKTVATEELRLAVETVNGGSTWIDPSVKVLGHPEGSVEPEGERLHSQAKSISDEFEERPPKLSKRELEVLNLAVSGLSNAAIAAKLSVSLDTVKSHMRNIFDKLNVNDRTQAATKALKYRLVI